MTAPIVNYVYEAKVEKIIDGDTLDLDVDLGFHVHVQLRFRLHGINAPEKNTNAGKASKAYLESLCAAGSEVIIASQKPATAVRQEKYGRWLVAMWLVGGEVSVNAWMVASDHAVVWDGKGARP